MVTKFTIKTPERRQDVLLVFLLLTVNMFHTFFSVCIISFDQVHVSWVSF